MKNMILTLIVFCIVSPVFSQESNDMKKLNELVSIRENIEMMEKLNTRGIVINPEIINSELERAGKLLGKDVAVTYDELTQATGSLSPPPNAWEKFTGFFSFVNIIMRCVRS